MWSKLLWCLVILEVVLAVHGLGRFVGARAAGLTVNRVSIGFGNRVLDFTTRRGTRLEVRLFVIGLRVDVEKNASSAVSSPRAEALSKIFVGASGLAANLLFATLLFFFFYFFIGFPSVPPVIGTLNANGPAARAGLKEGDHIIAMDGTSPETFDDISRFVRARPDREMIIEVQRDGKVEQLRVRSESHAIQDRPGHWNRIGFIGIGFTLSPDSLQYRGMRFTRAVETAASQTADTVLGITATTWQLLGGEPAAHAEGGPISIFRSQAPPQPLQLRIAGFCFILAYASLLLFTINLVPLSTFDSGKFVLLVVEAIRGAPLSAQVYRYAFLASLAVLSIASIWVGVRITGLWRWLTTL